MSKVALYFRRWKNYTRQKNAGEDWTFATKLTDFSENFEDENGFNADVDIFQVKFLGCAKIDAAKSEEATANAIKNIISAAKATSKKLQRLKLSICPRGIETFDVVTGETLHKVSIYKISYCSADAAHNNVFAFIAGTGHELGDEMCNNDTDELACYAFLCAKRKIAYNLTITVAKNFERAYDMWKKSEQRKNEQCQTEQHHRLLHSNTLQIKSIHANEQSRSNIAGNGNLIQTDARKNLLIDFNSDTANTMPPVERQQQQQQQQLLQTAWVSFDDEPLMNENNASHSMPGKVFENSLWDMNVICS